MGLHFQASSILMVTHTMHKMDLPIALYLRNMHQRSKATLRGYVEAIIEGIEGSKEIMEYRAPVLIFEAKHLSIRQFLLW